MSKAAHSKSGLGALTLTALGIVYGDLGTSPLYTLKTVLDLAGGVTPATILGLLSLLFWTLVIITSVKYVAVVMRVDNDGEGGILALMSLIGIQRQQRPFIVALGLFGAALIYGDGIITPAISVLSALEGLTIATPVFTPYVLPLTVVILALLFLVQPFGTAKIGRLFGPVMTLWFLVIGGLGLWGVAQHPSVLQALNPLLGIAFLVHGGMAGFVVLGGVFLCVTGAEALYADMGHVGARPIRLAWYGLVLPSLVLNYAGQGAILLEGGSSEGNIFFHLCPPVLLIPMVGLATLATIIASQAIITGAFSMTRQAIQLGWCPRMHITQTSSEGYGQIYVGAVNWIMMLVTIALALTFRKSDNLAAAYGIAVSLTMLLTSCLLFVAMREVWRWSVWAAGAVAGFFALIDATFVAANALKILDGGWVPLLLAAIVFGLMWTWHRGTVAVSVALKGKAVSVSDFLQRAEADAIPRVPGTAVFLTRAPDGTPPVMQWHLRNNRALHRHLVALNVQVKPIPWVDPANRIGVEKLGENFWRLTARYGFMERPDIPTVIAEADAQYRCTLQLNDVTYYVGHETVLHRLDGHGMPLWLERIFAFMLRNSAQTASFFNLPKDGVVEIGRQVEI
jgi:KUP system potassium uptake protein